MRILCEIYANILSFSKRMARELATPVPLRSVPSQRPPWAQIRLQKLALI